MNRNSSTIRKVNRKARRAVLQHASLAATGPVVDIGPHGGLAVGAAHAAAVQLTRSVPAGVPPIPGTRRDEARLQRRLARELARCARWTTRDRHPKTGKLIVRTHTRETRRAKRLRARLVRYDARRQLRALGR